MDLRFAAIVLFLFWVGSVGAGLLCLHRFLLTRNLKKKAQDLPGPSKYSAQKCVALSDSSPPNTVPLLDSSYGYLPLPTPPYNIQSSNEHQFSCLFSNPSGIAEQYFCGPPLAHSSQHDLPKPLYTTCILPKSDLYNLAAEARFKALGSLPFQDQFNGFYRPDSFSSIDRGYVASHYNGHLSSVADLVQPDPVQAIVPKKLHGIGETGTSMTGCDSAHVIGMEEPMDSPLVGQRENLGQRGLSTLSLLEDQILHEKYMEALGKTEGITKQWQDLGCPPPHSSEHDLPESSGPKDWSNWYKEIWWNCAMEMLREAKKKMGTLPGQDPSYGLLRLHQSSRMGPLPNDEGYLRDFSGPGLSNAPLSAVKNGPLLDTAMDELLHQSSRMGSPPNDEGYVRDFSGPGISNAALSAGENGPLLDTAMDKLLHQSSRMGPLPNDEGYVIDFSGSGLSNAPLSAVENGPLLDTAMDKSLCSGGAATPLTPLTGCDSADMILLRCINSHGREKLG